MKSSCYCGDDRYIPLFSKERYAIVKCTCGQVRTIALNGAAVKSFYQEEDVSIYEEKEELFRQIFSTLIAFVQRYIKKGRLLDIGAGSGLLVSEAKKAGFLATGIEPSKAMVAMAKKNFNITLECGVFTKKRYNTFFDVVVLNHVLEHIDDPVIMMKDIVSVLRPSGYLVIGVPNFDSFMAVLKRSKWQSLIPDQHRWHFSLHALDALVTQFGFVRVGLSTENHDRAMHYWWKKPLYAILDTIALFLDKGEAILVVYKKV